MAKALAGHMVVTHFDDQFWPQRLPFSTPLGAPPARSSRSIPGKAGRRDEIFEPLCQGLPVEIAKRRRKPDVVELILAIVETEKSEPTTRVFRS